MRSKYAGTLWPASRTPTMLARGVKNSNSAASPHSPAGSTNSTGRRSKTTISPSTLAAASKVGSRLPMVSTPLIAPLLRMFSLSCVLINTIVAGEARKTRRASRLEALYGRVHASLYSVASHCARGCGAKRARLPRLYGEPSPLLSSILRTNSRYHLPRYPVNTGLVSDAGLPRVASVRPALPEVGRHEARGFVGLFECCWHQALRPRVEGEVPTGGCLGSMLA